MLVALRVSRLLRSTLPHLPASFHLTTFNMKQTKINAFFVKKPDSGSGSPSKSFESNGSRDSPKKLKDEVKSKAANGDSPVKRKAETKKNTRKRAVIYSDSEEDEIPVAKSSQKRSKEVKSPEPEEKASPVKAEVDREDVPAKSPSPRKQEKASSPKKHEKTSSPKKQNKKVSPKQSDKKSPKSSEKKNDLRSVKSGRVTKSKKSVSKPRKTASNNKKSQEKKSSKSDSEEEEEKSSHSEEEMEEPATKKKGKSPKSVEKKNGSASAKRGKEAKSEKSGSKTKKISSSKKSQEKKVFSTSESEDEQNNSHSEKEVEEPVKPKKEKSPENEKTVPKMFGAELKSGKNETKALGFKGWNIDYDPSKNKYHPINDASWSRGQRVPYLALSITLKKIEETSSRLKNIEILANFFRSVILLSPQDLLCSIYLCLNKLAPAYEGIELGIAETSLAKAIAQSTGRSEKDIKLQLQEKDLGEIAEHCRTSQKTLFQPTPLTVAGVFAKLKEIAGMTGKASQQKKISLIQAMLVACKYSEARFVVRSLAGKLRIGLAEQSLLQAIAQACYLTPPNQNQADDSIDWPPKEKMINAGKGMHPDAIKSQADEVAMKLKSCYCECPNYDILVEALLKDGLDGLEEHCQLTPGIPPRPMLAQPTKGVDDILQRFTGKKFTCEFKYDGERAQIHLLEDGSVQVYSRNQENNTLKYPDIVNRFKDCIGPDVKSCIVDSEAVAWDREKETILPFQVLSTRKRKDANESEIKVQVIIFGFDLIYFNGESLTTEPLVKRRELLRDNFKIIPGQFDFAKSLDTDDMEQVQEFLEESIKGNCEGLMVKTLEENASYELARRSHKWLKLKKDYLASGGDSLDLVVIGGFSGKGKRQGHYGAYLLACYDPENEEFQTICKLGTGFSDEDLEQHSTTLKNHVISKPKPYYQFHSNLTPDYWFDAVVVWEVKCADLSLSPVHKAAAGHVDPERGISLRFPRFIRIRDDKSAEDATSASQVALMYNNQDIVKNAQGNSKDVDEDDFY